jgi:DNA-binding NarL/FixJ family response regulator
MSSRVLIADGAKIVRDAIRRLLNGQPEIEIVGEAADFAQAIGMIEELKPQIVILDLYMPIGSESSLDDVRDQVRSSGVQVLAISIYLDETTQELAKAIGAPFFVDKMKLGHELIPAVKTLAIKSSEEPPRLKQE